MCWVAFDRALRLAYKRSLSGTSDVRQRTRDEIRNDIFTNFWDNDLQVLCSDERHKRFGRFGAADADDEVYQSRRPDVAVHDESDRKPLNRRYACPALRS